MRVECMRAELIGTQRDWTEKVKEYEQQQTDKLEIPLCHNEQQLIIQQEDLVSEFSDTEAMFVEQNTLMKLE
jgi:hypothetical protein